MKTSYHDIDILFTVENVKIHALNIVFELFTRTIPSHSHGNNCYEIHYIPAGYGKLVANGQYYDISPNTLFVTGPHIEHAQTPLQSDPMQEYCIYIKIRGLSSEMKDTPVLSAFTSTPFWIGQDTQGVHALMKQLFYELEHSYTGQQDLIRLFLSQLLIFTVRNYEERTVSNPLLSYNILPDSKAVIMDEYFLYEYQTLSLEDLSGRLNLSMRQTQRLLMDYYGKSFQQKKAEARMSVAAILLSDQSLSITVIAEKLGYSSIEHFSSSFRKFYNMSPREFRKKIS